jgi:3-oxoadipate enol-lactonase
MPDVISKDGVRLHYELHDYTDPWKYAPVLILQHGYSRSSRFWWSMIPYLSRFFRVVCPDLRGLGESSRDFDLDAGITVENYVADIIAIADDLGAETFHYAGESLGGIIGMVVAARNPDRVRTLSLLAAPLSISLWTQQTFALDHPTWQDALRIMGSRAWSAAVNTATRFPPETDPKMLDWYAEETGKSDVNVLIAMSRLASKADATPVLDQIRAPVLGLYPAGGRITADHEIILRDRVKNIQIVHLPTSYHMVWVLAPAPCADHMLHFMAVHDGTVCRE